MALDDHLVNPQVLRSLYGEILPDALVGIRIRSVNLNWRGPTVRLRIDLPGFPRTPPAEWGDADTVQCQLEFLAVEPITVAEWKPPVLGDVRMVRVGDDGARRMRVEVVGRGADLRFECHERATVRHVSAFRCGSGGDDGGPHRFVSKVDSRLHTFLPATDERAFYEH
ncbi:Imm50 family immunity protein [Streptomyces sp. NPDC002677]|uniref:Imm50 family immunity protein n=1 Tax=unclassified Streptomyces TaxID=2593676 RepID=UPI00331B10FA